MHRVRAICYFVFYISASVFDLWERVRVHLLTYKVECESEWKLPIVLRDVNTLWNKFSVKKTCLYADFGTRDNDCVHSFEHNFALGYPTWCVSTKLYQLQHVTTCKFSLKRYVSAPFWLTRMCPCQTFNICGHDWAETFHCCEHRIGPWDAFTVKRSPSTQLFDLRKHVYVQQISYHTMFFLN